MGASQSTLVYRPKAPVVGTTMGLVREDSVYEDSSSGEEEGFHMVHRPKPVEPTPTNLPSIDLFLAQTHSPSNTLPPMSLMQEEPMSSPEIIPSQPIDILAATGSNYSDDDDWTML